MSEEQQLPISIKPIINYPQEAQVDKTYLMTIDLEISGDGEWQYTEEEYLITCILETLPRSLFSSKPMGEPTLVLHRFGGTYGPAKFLLKAAPKPTQGKITITLVNSWGIELQELSLADINVKKTVSHKSKPVGTYELDVSWQTSRNPYIFGTPIAEPERLFGVENVFRFIEDNLSQGAQIIFLYGQRRIGKSSVLNMIPHFIKLENFVFVRFDLQSFLNKSLIDILYRLATAIIAQLSLHELTPPTLEELQQDLNAFSLKFLPQVYEQIKDTKLVLLLDEFNFIFHSKEPGDFLRYLQRLLRQQEKFYIISALDYVNFSNISSIFNLFKSVLLHKVGLLDEISAKQLITKPAEGLLEYSEDAIQAILQISVGHPYFTQAICHTIFIQARNENNSEVTAANVENSIETAIETAEGGLAGIWDRLSIAERVVFTAAAQAQQIAIEENQELPEEPLKLLEKFGVIPTDSLIEASANLVDNDFLDDTKRRVKVEFVRRWLMKRHTLKREIRELENLEPAVERLLGEANKLMSEGLEQRALDLYQEVLNINPNHFTTVLHLAEGYSRLGNNEKAVEFYARAYQFDSVANQSEFVRSLLAYGDELITQAKLDQAQEQFTKVLQIEPNNTQAQEYRQQAREPRRPNPFIVGIPVPPERFFGRNSEIVTAFEQIFHRGHLAIWGGPGMGKSSFLDKLASPQAWQEHELDSSQAVIVRLNCEIISPFTASSFWREVLKQIRETLNSESELHTEIEQLSQTEQITETLNSESELYTEVEKLLKAEQITRKNIEIVLQKLSKNNKFLLLLVDDYDAALYVNESYTEANMREFLSDCRSLAVHIKQNLSMIVTSNKRLNELGTELNPHSSPWYNHYLFLNLRPFTDREVEQFLRYNIPNITQKLSAAIREIAGGHPDLVQIAGFVIYRQLRDQNIVDAQTFVDEFESTTTPVLDRIWQRCSSVEQALLILIALFAINQRLSIKSNFDFRNIHLILTQRERDLINLIEQGVITRNSSERNEIEQYSFSSLIMERFVIREIWNIDDLTFKALQKEFLNLMSHQQNQQVTNMIVWLQNNKNQVPPLVDTVVNALD